MHTQGDRLENLLGVLMLAADDRVKPAIESGLGQRGAGAGALVHLATYSGESTEQLARVLTISQPGAVAVVERLVAAGFVERHPGADRRTHALHITNDGLQAVDHILRARRDRLAELLAPLSHDERDQLTSTLEKVVAGLAQNRRQARTACRLCDRTSCCSGPGCPLDHTVTPANSEEQQRDIT